MAERDRAYEASNELLAKGVYPSAGRLCAVLGVHSLNGPKNQGRHLALKEHGFLWDKKSRRYQLPNPIARSEQHAKLVQRRCDRYYDVLERIAGYFLDDHHETYPIRAMDMIREEVEEALRG